MPFRFEWRDETQRAITYIAEGDWNWRDYHHAARASAFTLMSAEHPVDSVIDLRGSTRIALPAGAGAHLRSFGRVTQARLTGRAAVIGSPDVDAEGLRDGVLQTADGFVKFVDSETELAALLTEWADNPPAR
ncbi:MAG: hypothetical protein J4G18_03370 [Anaerolineae bacterium]|nr:hypothetical protein [Anaerolineae bacterium]